jgi:hypothetical protein
MQSYFTRFVAMGPSRSLGELARQLRVGVPELAALAHTEKWFERCAEIDKRAADHFMDDAAMTVAAVTKLQLQIAAEVQMKAMQAFRSLNFTRVEQVIAALKLSVEMQRKGLFLDDQQQSTEEKVSELLMRQLRPTVAVESKPFLFDATLAAPSDPTEIPEPEPKLLRAATVEAERAEVAPPEDEPYDYENDDE